MTISTADLNNLITAAAARVTLGHLTGKVITLRPESTVRYRVDSVAGNDVGGFTLATTLLDPKGQPTRMRKLVNLGGLFAVEAVHVA